jgi:hypothetical protein
MIRKRAWHAVSWVSGFLCALVVKKLLRVSYRAVRKDTDPATAFDPSKAGFSWPDALLWAAAAGIGLVIARIVGDRLAALGWQAATGNLPPGTVEDPAVG